VQAAATATTSAKQARQYSLLISIVLALSACTSTPHASRTDDSGARIAKDAAQFIGTRYRYGGDEPRKGFDCSGLVFYTHDREGLEVPRTAALQSRAAKPVPIEALAPGDLIFFRIASRQVDHVGIYAGKGRFIHAPRSGDVVSFAYLDDPYYRRHLTGAGSFWRASARP
jgi:cell wall-associated NlpC family hydrolase